MIYLSNKIVAMFTFSEENYLKAIYHLEIDSIKGISTNAIAKKLETKASSVTDMVKKLSEKKLIIYKKYQGVTLTDFGKQTAANIVRKHRLWEVFLVEKLNFSWDEVHDVAEQLEHIKSSKLIDEIKCFTTRPDTLFGLSFLALSVDHPLSKFYINDKKFLDFKQKCSETGTTEASIENGVLRIVMDKKEERKSKKVKIRF